MHRQAKAFVKLQVMQYHLSRPGLDVLEIGSRNVNGAVRGLFEHANYTGIDLVAGEGVDVVGDVTTAALPDNGYDVVLCLEVLEHSPKAEQIVKTAYRVLRPHGVLVLTAAGRGRYPHSSTGGPLKSGEYYARINAEELGVWMRDFAFKQVMYRDVHCDVQAVGKK